VAEAVDAQRVMSVAEATVPPRPAAPAPLAAPPAPVALATFDGGADNNTSIPLDTAGAVLRTTSSTLSTIMYRFFDRAGVPAAPTVSLNDSWSGLGNTGDTFDPRRALRSVFRRALYLQPWPTHTSALVAIGTVVFGMSGRRTV